MTIQMKFKSKQNQSTVNDSQIMTTYEDLITGKEHRDFGKGGLELLICVAQSLHTGKSWE